MPEGPFLLLLGGFVAPDGGIGGGSVVNTPKDGEERIDLWATLPPEKRQRIVQLLVQLAKKIVAASHIPIEQVADEPIDAPAAQDIQSPQSAD
jgi:hypothetical protein